ncbi:MAG: cobalamin biosynthesis protein CobD [Dethiobacter sp.]|jgi:adenosylcobinamide-phosphate synthase|nr:cobalamin biosynthesis protein CobD [Dethiobacter sp.]MBS3900355.1 cobalamin biosynthesis protein CobD [Dethiobacter sp.]MBS3983188.1 cobalamin biosynthesis protein CobD [Dethiobacter sp.]
MLILLAFLLDALIGDPRWLPHPVVWFGKLISFLEKRLYNCDHSAHKLQYRGALLVLVVLCVVYASSLGLISIFSFIHPLAGAILTVMMLATALATRSLQQAAEEIYLPLQDGNIKQARQAVAMVVGRDSEQLSEREVSRAAVETVAENTVDGVTAPLFYALLGGAPLALLYKAINTMDSMLGYKNDRYLWFGRAAAKLDDAANWLPARLTIPVMLLAAAVLRLPVRAAWTALCRDGKKHPSPNSGLTEALMAGALGVTLGGENRYGGRICQRMRLWQEGRPPEANDIREATTLMMVTAVFFLAVGLLLQALVLNLL